MSFLPNHDVTHSEKRRQQQEYHWALDNQVKGKPQRRSVERGAEELPFLGNNGVANYNNNAPPKKLFGEPNPSHQQKQKQQVDAAVFDELDAVKHQFGSLEQHVLTELNERKIYETSYVIPQIELINETLSKYQHELKETKQMNQTLFQMIKDIKNEDKVIEERLRTENVMLRSEIDLIKADMRLMNSKVKDMSSGPPRTPGPNTAAPKELSDEIRLLEKKLEEAIDDMKLHQQQQTDSMVGFFNGKIYQDLMKRLENTEKKCSIEVSAIRMNQEVESNSNHLKVEEFQSNTIAEYKLLHANINSLVLEFNSLKAITKAEIDEAMLKLECVEKTWDDTVGDGMRSLHTDLSRGLAQAQVQHEELKSVLSAEITARRKTDKKQLTAIKSLSERVEKEISTLHQDIVNATDHSNSRYLSIENSVSMVASSFASQLASLQESMSTALRVLKEDISARGLSSKHKINEEKQSIKVLIDELTKLSSRIDGYETSQNSRLKEVGLQLADFMQNVAIKFEDVEDSVRKEGSYRDKDIKKLHTAVSGAIVAQSQKISESSATTLNKIRQATMSILEVMDRKLDDLEDRINQREMMHQSVLGRSSSPSSKSMLPPDLLRSTDESIDAQTIDGSVYSEVHDMKFEESASSVTNAVEHHENAFSTIEGNSSILQITSSTEPVQKDEKSLVSQRNQNSSSPQFVSEQVLHQNIASDLVEASTITALNSPRVVDSINSVINNHQVSSALKNLTVIAKQPFEKQHSNISLSGSAYEDEDTMDSFTIKPQHSPGDDSSLDGQTPILSPVQDFKATIAINEDHNSQLSNEDQFTEDIKINLAAVESDQSQTDVNEKLHAVNININDVEFQNPSEHVINSGAAPTQKGSVPTIESTENIISNLAAVGSDQSLQTDSTEKMHTFEINIPDGKNQNSSEELVMSKHADTENANLAAVASSQSLQSAVEEGAHIDDDTKSSTQYTDNWSRVQSETTLDHDYSTGFLPQSNVIDDAPERKKNIDSNPASTVASDENLQTVDSKVLLDT